MKITVKIEGLDNLSKQFQLMQSASLSVLGPAAQAGADVIKEAANQDAPGPNIDTDMKHISQTKVEVKIGPNKRHWYYQFKETGASAHIIKPKNRKAMTWPEGPIIKKANHTGMAAEPFLQKAIENNQGKILAAISSVLRRVIR